jgi:hypothetical protein
MAGTSPAMTRKNTENAKMAGANPAIFISALDHDP